MITGKLLACKDKIFALFILDDDTIIESYMHPSTNGKEIKSDATGTVTEVTIEMLRELAMQSHLKKISVHLVHTIGVC